MAYSINNKCYTTLQAIDAILRIICTMHIHNIEERTSYTNNINTHVITLLSYTRFTALTYYIYIIIYYIHIIYTGSLLCLSHIFTMLITYLLKH